MTILKVLPAPLVLLVTTAVLRVPCSAFGKVEAPAPVSESVVLSNSPRTSIDFDRDWCFSKTDPATAAMPAFDDSAWRRLNLPHDWSIEEAFNPNFASGTGFLPGGIGWYRKHFHLDPFVRGKIVTIEFDGIYNHSEIWLNGNFVGGRPYGYSSFECDLTPCLKFGTNENVITVRVDHSRFADSRYYTGSGIYRHVRLRITEPLHIAWWGTFVTTPEVSQESTVIQIQTSVVNLSGVSRNFSLQSEIIAPDGNAVGGLTTTGGLENETNQSLTQKVRIAHPQLWSLETPRLYTLKSRLSADSNTVDETTTTFGVRSLRFDPDKGFCLNDKALKIKGVCIHHDAGCLGAAVPDKVLERRLRALKEVGANAIRTSHNPPAPELLDLCDRLGLLVMDEAFDEFTPGKNKWIAGRNVGTPARFGYAEDFAAWSVRDVQDMVRRDRNHPSIIMWSIGNEIDFANDPFSHPVLGDEYHPDHPPAENLVNLAKPLVAAVKQVDATRPVTMALANVAMSEAVGLPELLDVVGYNYQERRYPEDHSNYPKRFVFGSENSQRYNDWAVARDNDYVGGQFLWVGIDFLGEAASWPNHGSRSGLLDLCGFKKPLAWFRQSLWNDQPMVYLCASLRSTNETDRSLRQPVESWNWPAHANVSVRSFTTCPEVQLLLNNRLIGTRRRADAYNGVLNWNVPFEPGVLEAVGRDGDKTVCEFALKTAGRPSRIELSPDTTRLAADGQDICHVEYRVVDSHGVLVPDAENELSFEVSGPAKVIGLENGNLNSTEPYGTERRQAFQGRGLAILQSTQDAGRITVKAKASHLEPAAITLESR